MSESLESSMADPSLDIKFLNTPLTRTAFAVCLLAHEGQTDRAEQPYYTHPIRVAERMSTETETATALLHDVIEDSDYALDFLREYFPIHVVDAVDRLTRRDGELMEEYFSRVTGSQLALKVKLADCEDNMRLERYHMPEPSDVWACNRYYARYKALRSKLDDAGWASRSYSRVMRIRAKSDRIIAANPALMEANKKLWQ